MFRQMEKLIKLLNEYHFFNTDCINYVLDEEENRIYLKQEFDSFYNEQRINAERIISKKFGFIKWLVENEKIKPLGKFIGWETDEDEPYIQFDLVDQYIAYLSIQDEPIEFLVSILK